MSRDDATKESAGQTVQVNGADIFYREHGRGRPLLLLHGGTITGDSWGPYIAALAEHFQLIVPDTRGHGWSSTPDGTLTYPMLADDVVALFRVLGLEKPVIAGYSDGGQTVLEIGMRHPDLPGALVAGGAFFRFNQSLRTWLRDAFGDGPDVDVDRFKRDHADGPLGSSNSTARTKWKTVLAQVKPMWATEFSYSTDELARIVAPTLVLLGDRDEILPVEEAIGAVPPAAREPNWPSSPTLTHGAFFSSKIAALAAGLILDFLERACPPARPGL